MSDDVSNDWSLRLPWPHSQLSPNARVHWAQLYALKRQTRQEAYALAMAAGAKQAAVPHVQANGKLVVRYLFVPPDRRARDLDNLIARNKASQDGLADALGIDDRYFSPWYVMADAPDPSGTGYIEVRFGAGVQGVM